MAYLTRVLRSALALAAVIFIGLAGVAIAGTTRSAAVERFAVGSTALTTAQQIAVEHWGEDPCGGDVKLVWKRQASDINALSLWSTTSTDPYADPADNQDCVVQLNPVADWDWPKLCTIVMHEYGHLNGHAHDSKPGHLMSAVYSTPAPECATAESRAAASRRTASASRAS